MHVAVYLLNQGLRIGTVDVDARQGTFTRYFEHRKAHAFGKIPMPQHIVVHRNDSRNADEAESRDREAFDAAIGSLTDCDYVVVDTPGNDNFLSRYAHSHADTLLTPLNDSFVDLDVLVRSSENDNVKTLRPSIYAEMVWDQRKERAKRGGNPIDWIVIRNRLTTLYNKNRRDIGTVLEALAKRISFRLGVGFCDRVVFKELFLSGLTLLDLDAAAVKLNLSHVAARQELRELISLMKLPNLS
jgi:chromosome partitioning protein